MKARLRIIFCCSVSWATLGHGQIASNQDQDLERDRIARLSDAPIASTHSAGSSKAIGPITEGMDSLIYNPANTVGRSRASSKKDAFASHFGFPYLVIQSTEGSDSFLEKSALAGEPSSTILSQMVEDASEEQYHFGRSTLMVPAVGLGRMIVAPLYDLQFNAVKASDTSDVVDLNYQKKVGAIAGLSFTDKKKELALGISAAFFNMDQIRGDFLASDMADTEVSKQQFEDATGSYSVLSLTTGLSWRINHKASPTISVTMKDLGGTDYSHQSGIGSDYKVEQNTSVGFAVSPSLGKWGFYNFVLETDEITNDELSLDKKIHASTGFDFGGRGSFSILSIYGGYDHLGGSYGGHINIGFIGLQYATFNENIGTYKEPIAQQRQSITASIDLAR